MRKATASRACPNDRLSRPPPPCRDPGRGRGGVFAADGGGRGHDDVGAVFEQEITEDLPANTQFLSPRLFMNNGATAAAVAYDCSGVYIETDY